MSQFVSGEPQPARPHDTCVVIGPDVIHPETWHDRARRPEAGAVVQFIGTVRNHHLGASVAGISYEAYAEMARVTVERIVEEVFVQTPFWTASAIHRTGPLDVGDISVCVTVGASHRAAAFEACRTIMDRLKSEAPIWKRERLTTGETRWLEEHVPQVGARGE